MKSFFSTWLITQFSITRKSSRIKLVRLWIPSSLPPPWQNHLHNNIFTSGICRQREKFSVCVCVGGGCWVELHFDKFVLVTQLHNSSLSQDFFFLYKKFLSTKSLCIHHSVVHLRPHITHTLSISCFLYSPQ